ncbi:apoptogenic mitochondrial [Brachionus plicatilis]|uniref:Apoptogenic mitochondrial n=1 Tax=Brachionus plicatilis TaxID=10195 RepID=A0A3M7SJP7_BRAPC|nr:apoptogenic mitochondrial [Brachionus plicatilis]
MIGPADKISNLRPVLSFIPSNESQVEREYRLLKDQVFDFNQQYWTQQNLKFVESRKKFIEKHRIDQKVLNRNKLEQFEINDPDTDQMNEFYKTFLDENYHNHYEYNRLWFRKNLALLWPATKVVMHRFKQKIFLLNK